MRGQESTPRNSGMRSSAVPSGRRKSRMATSGRKARNFAFAEAQSSASSTSKPCDLRKRRTPKRGAASSSTSNTRLRSMGVKLDRFTNSVSVKMRKLLYAATIALFLSGPRAPAAERAMTYIYHPPESPLDVRYQYHWEILRTALERTKTKWGPYRMVASERMTESRQRYEIEHATGKLTVMYLSTTPEFESTLVPVRIPVDKNLGGYCVFLIRAEDKLRFAKVKTLDDLRRFSYGLGLGWVDVEILKANGFNVVTGSNYDGLFEMLVQKRFDVFLPAATEVLDEYDQPHKTLSDLTIEDNILLYYPLPMYFC